MRKAFAALLGILIALVTTVVLYAVASYPSSVKSFSTRVDGQTIAASWFNDLQDEVVAIEGGLLNGLQHVLKPQANDTYDLGTSALGWQDLYLTGTLYLDGTNPYTGWTVVTTTSTGTQNDFAPGLSGNTILRANNASALTITGFTGGYDGQRLRIVSIGAGQVEFAHQNASSTAAYRLINFVTSGNTPLAAGVGTADYIYDGTTARWRLVAHEQGAHVSYTTTWSNGAIGNGTLSARYYLRGRTVHFDISMTAGATTTFGGGSAWLFTYPVTLTDATAQAATVYALDSGTSHWLGTAVPNSTTAMILAGYNTQNFAATVPFAWANGDVLRITGTVTAS